MLVDIKDINDQIDNFDYCIIGAGPAGISLALSLSKSNAKILLLEAGGSEWSERSQDIYKGLVVGNSYFDLDISRLRYFGGSSNHWQGWCRTLDKIDFLPKANFKNAVWPITKEALDPYLGQAAEILEIPEIPSDQIVDHKAGIKQIHFVYSPSTSFAKKYGPQITESKNITLCFDANVTGINSDGQYVDNIDVENFDGLQKKIHANRFILATGGIENNRLLLWSNEKNNGSLIHKSSPLGRYWMEHPHQIIGNALVDRSFVAKPSYYSLMAQKQKELSIFNCGLRLEEARQYEGTKEMIADLACAAPDLAQWAMNKLGKDLICGTELRAAWEQEPIIDNRVQLSKSKKDYFGIPRTELHWRTSSQDIKTVKLTALQFGEFLINSGKGRIRLDPWVLGNGEYPKDGEHGGHHHMGGTRMATTVSHGVVDKNCKVFGQKNLYIAGSSVFPTGGHANPTLTIVQLSLRLAEHLRTIDDT